jgi:hypothetical protein
LTLSSDVKETLLCGKSKPPSPDCLVPPFRFQFLVLAQGIFSAMCFFFIGLALRNYFRVK